MLPPTSKICDLMIEKRFEFFVRFLIFEIFRFDVRFQTLYQVRLKLYLVIILGTRG